MPDASEHHAAVSELLRSTARRCGQGADYGYATHGLQPLGITCRTVEDRAEVAELADALDSKSSGASPRAGSTPAFGIGTSPLVQP